MNKWVWDWVWVWEWQDAGMKIELHLIIDTAISIPNGLGPRGVCICTYVCMPKPTNYGKPTDGRKLIGIRVPQRERERVWKLNFGKQQADNVFRLSYILFNGDYLLKST